MEILLILIFVVGYLLITVEHSIKIDKLIPALGMMGVLWAVIALNHLPVFEINLELLSLEPAHLDEVLLHHLGKTAEILIFLLGAMTIVEIIDFFRGFSGIKKLIKSRSKVTLLWIFGFLSFGLSAIIDNLTATIVLITILQKLVTNKELKLWYAGLIIIAANAGGAFSPIGDITTTMLWIADKVTTLNIIKFLVLPSIVCMVVPFLISSKFKIFKGEFKIPSNLIDTELNPYGNKMLFIGLGSILFVPFFKTVTHLPPYVGMMLALAFVATVAEFYSNKKFNISKVDFDHDMKADDSPVHASLTKIELPSILFFLGILMAVGALESVGILFNFADWINEAIPNSDVVIVLLGHLSALIDNVPLVAASIGMFPNPIDDPLWHGIAYSAGTGGSMLIIGSAAGVVAMGMEKIDFFWYMKNITILAMIGFWAGYGTFMFLRFFMI
ncbi:MAG: sodium:proton antiporter NhaD [Flavobacteriaceae bacterium]|mgnify:CR=1 FL=1|nr:sodium:proton antiporter NhaD [Flavobacteriaceae bacterium]MBT6689598.1 sodium:proton antiporter NhaD [Flavobacteriaceae bacterium]MBT7555002.1 sodium:proton antiporter NhaD [Flavobacteriaceae bacterium]